MQLGFFRIIYKLLNPWLVPFNLSSIPVGNMGMNHSNASQALSLVPALFNIPRKNHSINISQIERREQEDRMVESINNYEFNTTVKPF